MIPTTTQNDGFRRFAQLGASNGIMPVRLTEVIEGNQYQARPIEFDEEDETQFVGQETLTVTNLAEPADSDGLIDPDTDAVAMDVEGRWIVFVRPATNQTFPAKVTGSQGSGAYYVLEQVPVSLGVYTNKENATQITAQNLAELSLGPGAAVDTNTIVIISAVADTGNPPVLHYMFDHPAYAKYLD